MISAVLLAGGTDKDDEDGTPSALPAPLRIAECNIFRRHGMLGKMLRVKAGDIHDLNILIEVEIIGAKFITCGRNKVFNGGFWFALPCNTMSRLQ